MFDTYLFSVFCSELCSVSSLFDSASASCVNVSNRKSFLNQYLNSSWSIHPVRLRYSDCSLIIHEVVDLADLWKKRCLDAKYLQFHMRELHSTPIDGAAIHERRR